MKKTITYIAIVISVLCLIWFIFYIKDKIKNKPFETKYFVELKYQDLEKLLNDKLDFVLVVHQDGCPHCEVYLPVVKKYSDKYEFTTYGINLSDLSDKEHDKFNNLFSIQGTPTTLFIKEGDELTTLNRLVGSNVTERKLDERIKSLGYREE